MVPLAIAGVATTVAKAAGAIIHFILFGYMMSSLQVTQSVAQAIGEMQVNRWLVMAAINLLLLVAGMFLPPAAIILMTTPILMPVINAAGFDPIWFGI